MEDKKEKAAPLLEELLQAVTFLIWFMLAWSVKKSHMNTVVALSWAFRKSGGYKKQEILDALHLDENLF